MKPTNVVPPTGSTLAQWVRPCGSRRWVVEATHPAEEHVCVKAPNGTSIYIAPEDAQWLAAAILAAASFTGEDDVIQNADEWEHRTDAEGNYLRRRGDVDEYWTWRGEWIIDDAPNGLQPHTPIKFSDLPDHIRSAS